MSNACYLYLFFISIGVIGIYDLGYRVSAGSGQQGQGYGYYVGMHHIKNHIVAVVM